MKYIIVKPKNTDNSLPSAIVFDDSVIHRDVARGIGMTHTVLSAGFVSRDQNTHQLFTHGESESLKMKPREGDRAILMMQIDHMFSALDIQNHLTLIELKGNKAGDNLLQKLFGE